MTQRPILPTAVAHGPLSSVDTIYELPDGRRCVVTFANRGTDTLAPVRNQIGELWVAFLQPGDVEPAHFDDWDRAWIAAELLRPVTPGPTP
ncbi:MAG: hypothetical protein QM733_03865 [Ilumatobacteraceae bacterium]